MTRSGSLITVPNTYTMYQQETDTYCIPATVKSILMYINGTSPSQSTIAETTGTDPTKIPDYLNDRQDECYYIYTAKSKFDQEGMCSRLYSTIVNNDVPSPWVFPELQLLISTMLPTVIVWLCSESMMTIPTSDLVIL